jgi:hypothetical protein
VLAFGSYRLLNNFTQLAGSRRADNGNLGSQGMSPTTHRLVQFLEYVAFLANSMVFADLPEVDIPLLDAWQSIAWALGGVILARGCRLWSKPALRRFIELVSLRWQHAHLSGCGASASGAGAHLPLSFGPERPAAHHGLWVYCLRCWSRLPP